MSFSITSHIQQDNTLARFSVSPSFEEVQNLRQYTNIDEAKESPLAQKMFYLPFVKKVVLTSDYIEIQRFDILEWEDVLEDVLDEVKNFLNDGGVVLNEVKQEAKTPITVYVESTPNPSVMKFVANKKIVEELFEFKNIDEAKDAPLAKELFHFPFVKEVFMDVNYVSITKFDVAIWEDVAMEIREFLRSYLEKGGEVVSKKTILKKEEESIERVDLDETSQQIVNIIEEYIKPAVASDGGNILFESYNTEDKSVKVILQGACSGCPSSTFTLKNGIESMLQEMLPGKVSTVTALNG